MIFKLFFIGIAFIFTVWSTPATQAADFSHALDRMDAIIVQMQELKAEFELIAQTLGQVPTPAVLGSVGMKTLSDDVRFGSTNDDIKRIQKLLATDPVIYQYGVASGYFGPKTQEAIRLFQSRFGLDIVGVVGPATRALLEVFLAAYPDGNYPDDVLKKELPQATSATSNAGVIQQSSIAMGTISQTSALKSINVTEADDEYIVKSYKTNGTRNRDLILYPKTEKELIKMISEKLKASESEVRTLIAKTDFDFSKTIVPTADTATKETASTAVEKARVAVYAVRRVIRNAELDGEDTSDADDLYSEARTLFTDARKALGKEKYIDALDFAQTSLDLSNQAEDLL